MARTCATPRGPRRHGTTGPGGLRGTDVDPRLAPVGRPEDPCRPVVGEAPPGTTHASLRLTASRPAEVLVGVEDRLLPSRRGRDGGRWGDGWPPGVGGGGGRSRGQGEGECRAGMRVGDSESSHPASLLRTRSVRPARGGAMRSPNCPEPRLASMSMSARRAARRLDPAAVGAADRRDRGRAPARGVGSPTRHAPVEGGRARRGRPAAPARVVRPVARRAAPAPRPGRGLLPDHQAARQGAGRAVAPLGHDDTDEWEFTTEAFSAAETYAVFDEAVVRNTRRIEDALAEGGGGLDLVAHVDDGNGNHPRCAACSLTWSRSTAGTPVTPTCCARRSTAGWARTRPRTGDLPGSVGHDETVEPGPGILALPQRRQVEPYSLRAGQVAEDPHGQSRSSPRKGSARGWVVEPAEEVVHGSARPGGHRRLRRSAPSSPGCNPRASRRADRRRGRRPRRGDRRARHR